MRGLPRLHPVQIGDRGTLALPLAGGVRTGVDAAPALSRDDVAPIDGGVGGSVQCIALARTAAAAMLCPTLLLLVGEAAVSRCQLAARLATRPLWQTQV